MEFSQQKLDKQIYIITSMVKLGWKYNENNDGWVHPFHKIYKTSWIDENDGPQTCETIFWPLDAAVNEFWSWETQYGNL